MKITIHKGINTIGGCITEIQSGNDRIMIDLGSNLPGTDEKDFSPEEIKEKTTGVKAILYTHYHGDHLGHFAKAVACKQYIGEGALEVSKIKFGKLQDASEKNLAAGRVEVAEKLDKSAEMKVLSIMETFRPNEALHFGNITVTPFFCSHSAFDSYMFLIEAEGKKVLHTGDFRDHGCLGKGLNKFIPAFVGQVDALITEGTMLCRGAEQVPTEAELKIEAQSLLERKDGPHHFFALCSSTDIDRLATFHKACKDAGAWLVVDPYQKEVLDKFTKYAGKHSDLFVFDKVKTLGVEKNFFDKIAVTGFIMAIRSSQISNLKKYYKFFPDAELIYSMWNGYRDESSPAKNQDIIDICKVFPESAFHYIHTSGHATPQAIRNVIEMTSPRKKLIIIHKDKNSDISLLNLSPEEMDKVVTGFDDDSNNTIEI